MKYAAFVVALCVATSCAISVRAAILEDFLFDDPDGTVITSTVNSANSGNNWLSQNTNITAGVENGSFRLQKGGESPTPVTGQVINVLNIANITSGRAWLVAELAGWSYTATASSPSERVRFAFVDNDPPATNSSTITAEANIDRAGGALQLNASALGVGAGSIAGTYSLPLVQTEPFKIAVEINKNLNTYSVHYKDGNDPWGTLGTAVLGDVAASGMPTGILRRGNGLRFAFTGTFNDTGEFVDVDRIYLTNLNPVPEPSSLALGLLAAGLTLVRRQK